MSDKIGNYIHYHFSNYLRYGTSIKEHNAQESSSAAFRQIKNDMKTYVINNRNEEDDAQYIEDYLNFYYTQTTTQNTQFLKGYSNIFESAKNTLIQRAEEFFRQQGLRFDPKTMTVFSATKDFSHVSLDDMNIASKFSKLGQGSTKVSTFKAIQKAYFEFKQIYDNLDKLDNRTQDEQNFIEAFNQLNNKFERLIGFLQFDQEDSSVSSSNWNSNVNKKLGVLTSMSGGRRGFSGSFVDELNQIGQLFVIKASSYYNGKVDEYFNAIYEFLVTQGEKAFQMSFEELMKAVESPISGMHSRVVGHQQGTYVLKADNFAIGTLAENNRTSNNNVSYMTKIGDLELSLNAVDQKTDLMITMPDMTEIPVSMKHYATKNLNNISLQSGSNLFKFLQDYPIFTNHYLNLTAQHFTGWGSAKSELIGGAGEIAQQYVWTIMAIKSLVGGLTVLSKGSENISQGLKNPYLILNNSGKYKVYSTRNIAKELTQRIDKIRDYVRIDTNNQKFNHQVTDIWTNAWQKGYDDPPNISSAFSRISVLMQEVASINYDVQLNLTKFNTII